MTHELPPPVRNWCCPSCGLRDRTQKYGVHTQYHPCPAMHGFNTPLVEVLNAESDPQARHVLVEREDYGQERFAALRTEYKDGSNDVLVYAPVATTGATSHHH